jgi:hypothetical protein
MKTIGALGALLGAALIGGALISSTFAGSTPTATTTQTSPTGGVVNEEYLDAYLDTLAAELGVERSALGPAALAAANAAIDAAVAAGDLDEDRATAIKERLAELEDPASLLVRGFGHGGPGGFGGHRIGLGLAGATDAAAEALGIEPEALFEAFRDGTGLEELAEQDGVAYDTVKTAVLDAVNTALADDVADEDITQERADEIIDNVTDWLDDGGEGPGFIGGHRGGPRF